MKLLQFWLPGSGPRVGVLEGRDVIDITSEGAELTGTLRFLQEAAEQRRSVAEEVAYARERIERNDARPPWRYDALDVALDPSIPHLLAPIYPPEVWACGVTYRKSAEFRDEDIQSSKGIYEMVYSAPRPEVFFKGLARHCIGPNGAATIRRDSSFTAPEPELALVLGESGAIAAYTICDDVSAWDIERENPLYLPQSKIFTGSCVIGPLLVTADELPDPRALSVRCRIVRRGRAVFDESVGTDRIKRSFEELIAYLTLHNPVPIGTVLSTGTGIIVPRDLALQEGDTVEISVDGLGTLRHTMRGGQ